MKYYNFYNLTTFEVICGQDMRKTRDIANTWIENGDEVKYAITKNKLHECGKPPILKDYYKGMHLNNDEVQEL